MPEPPKVIDEDMLLFARALRDNGVPVPEIAKKLTIKTGKNAGTHPSVASLYRALTDDTAAASADDIPRPRRARIARPGDELTPEQAELRQRLQTR